MLNHALVVFLGFFAIMNPIANTAIFVGLTGQMDRKNQKKVAFKSLTVAFFIIVAFAILGKALFHFFGITLPALRITGGILVFLIGYHMLQGKSSSLHKSEETDKDISVSPLAVPLLSGPGTIATAMNYSASGDFSAIAVTLSMFALLCVITLICFLFAEKILKLIGKSGLSIITRLMGLILAVIGTQMLLQGLFAAIKSAGF